VEMQLRIKDILAKKGMTQSDLADGLGMHPVNLNRIINGKIDTNTSRLEEIADYLGVSVPALFEAPGESRTVRVKGYVQAGYWAETWELPTDEQYDVPVPADESLARYTLYAAEIRGPSMNRKWDEGTTVVFTDAIETHEEIEIGKRYIVERERADGLREATVKKLWRDDAGKIWLLPESDDPRFQQPIALDGDEDDTIRIVGRVRYAVSRE
jgi:transcriptional regulator with XRE-family HTH domain